MAAVTTAALTAAVDGVVEVLPSSDRDDVEAVASKREVPPVSFAIAGTDVTFTPAREPNAVSAAVKLADPVKLRELRAGVSASDLAAPVAVETPPPPLLIGEESTAAEAGEAFSSWVLRDIDV